MKRAVTEPETRIGNCCGCNQCPVPLFKLQGIFRYRCAACFEAETGHRHYLAPLPAAKACDCDDGRMCDSHEAQALREHAWMRGQSKGACTGVMSEQDEQDMRDAGRGHLVRP
jgi:hypothetical protein